MSTALDLLSLKLFGNLLKQPSLEGPASRCFLVAVRRYDVIAIGCRHRSVERNDQPTGGDFVLDEVSGRRAKPKPCLTTSMTMLN